MENNISYTDLKIPFGKNCWLGYCGRSKNIYNSESVHGRFFGVENEKMIFFNEEGDRVFRYVANVRNTMGYMSDGCGDPAISFIRGEFDFEVKKPLELLYIASVIKKLENKERLEKIVLDFAI